MRDSIQEMFGSIASHYDRTNAILSFGLFKLWNRALLKKIAHPSDEHLLDLCAGTGDISFLFLKYHPQKKVCLLDFCEEMLDVAQEKARLKKIPPSQFQKVVGDAQCIPLQDSSFDLVTIAYGIRNVKDPKKCIGEAWRVLRPEGRFGILELTRPNNSLLRFGHACYLKTLLPILGKWAAKNGDAYHYLSQTISSFQSPLSLKKLLIEAGFQKTEVVPLFGGIASLILGEK